MSEEFPLVTFVLLAYNQEKYIREAVEGALAQDYPNLEIIISDDASTDATWEIIENAVADYAGRHRVHLNRNPVNLGISGHVQKVFECVSGDLVVLAAGDDLSVASRVSELVAAWRAVGSLEAVIYSDVRPVDEESLEVTWAEAVYPGPHTLHAMATGNLRVLGATTAYTRNVVVGFPVIAKEVIHEDRVLPFRALLLGGQAIYVDAKLVNYRVNGGVSRHIARTMRDYVNAMARVEFRSAIDARQRLNDALHVGASSDCIRICEQTIRNHEAMMALAEERSFCSEVAAFRAWMAGVAFSTVFKFYVKKRLVSLGWNRELPSE